jgi:hypothetical protein
MAQKKTLKGYNSKNEPVISTDITGWAKVTIDKLKKEIERGPIGQAIGKIKWVEVTGEDK